MKELIKTVILLGALAFVGCSKSVYTRPASDSYQVKQDTNNKFGASAVHAIGDITGKLVLNSEACDSAVINAPLPNGFAHNDYCHPHPLSDALENGFTNVEADIFLIDGKLIIAHVFPYFKSDRTLESLYLKPLLEKITQNKGKVLTGYNSPITLLIDIKTKARPTYRALKPVLEKYRSILSTYDNGKMTYRAVTIVLSGHKPYSLIKKEKNRIAFIDEDLSKLRYNQVNNNVMAMASCNYSDIMDWDGTGSISNEERNALCAYVLLAHNMGLKVRLWASPEKEVVWDELLSCGVDLINTDQLVALKNYFSTHAIEKNQAIKNTSDN
jgi:hypothetical protein